MKAASGWSGGWGGGINQFGAGLGSHTVPPSPTVTTRRRGSKLPMLAFSMSDGIAAGSTCHGMHRRWWFAGWVHLAGSLNVREELRADARQHTVADHLALFQLWFPRPPLRRGRSSRLVFEVSTHHSGHQGWRRANHHGRRRSRQIVVAGRSLRPVYWASSLHHRGSRAPDGTGRQRVQWRIQGAYGLLSFRKIPLRCFEQGSVKVVVSRSRHQTSRVR
jgi:hypothetical protein